MPRVLIGNIAEMRVSISRAALLVKVTARMPPGVTLPVCMSQAMRVVRTRVLPEPAPARISADWSGSVTAASCSGLRLSRRLCIRAFANARFYRGLSVDESPTRLHSDLVLVLGEICLPFQRLDDGSCVLFGFEIGEAHPVDALLACFRGNDLGGVTRLVQGMVDIERLCELLRRGHGDFPLAAAARDPPALLLLGFRRPFPEAVHRHALDRPRDAALECVDRQGLVQREGPLAGGRELDF